MQAYARPLHGNAFLDKARRETGSNFDSVQIIRYTEALDNEYRPPAIRYATDDSGEGGREQIGFNVAGVSALRAWGE